MLFVRKVGIVGEGKMGTGIFNYLLDFDFDLVWICSSSADNDKLSRQFAKRIKRLYDAGILDRKQFDRLAQTPVTQDLTALQSCDLVIETIPENLGMKRDLFEQLDKIVKPEAIFASNSSSINPSEIEPKSQRTDKFTGLHFFYPVPFKNIVEFTITSNTSGQTISAIESFLNRIGRHFITLDEKNSFLLNKIFLDFQNEAFLIVQGGHCSYMEMDQLVRNHIFPFGVFDYCDSVGLDTMQASIQNYLTDYPHKSYYSQLIGTISDLVSQGRLGLKTQVGFYTYPLEANPVDEPLNAKEIVDHLKQTWLQSAKRFTALAHIPIDEANEAIKEYFDISNGPFDSSVKK